MGKRPSTPTSVFCQGWFDDNGVWNNGFNCIRWGGPNEKYCCGEHEKYCCPEPPPTTPTTTTTTTPKLPLTDFKGASEATRKTSKEPFDLIPVMAGAGVLLAMIIIFFIVLLIICCYCRSRRKKSTQPISTSKALTFNMEAQATSAVIAAQALQQQSLLANKYSNSNSFSNSLNKSINSFNNTSFTPVNFSPDNYSKPHEPHTYNNTNNYNNSHNNNESQLHCGCNNTEHHSPTVDLDSLIATMQHNINTSWQQQHPDIDLNPPIGGFDQVRPPSTNRIAGFLESPPYDAILQPHNADRRKSLSSPRISSSGLPYKASLTNPYPPPTNPLPYPLFSKQLDNVDFNRGFNYSPHQMDELRQFKNLIQEYADKKQKRDSGVLVEEPDIVQNTSSSSASNGKTSFAPYGFNGNRNNDSMQALPSPNLTHLAHH